MFSSRTFEQLKLEQGEGRVFKDWMEGPIHFPPTYKYKEGTDQFSGETSSTGEKRRSPAWQVSGQLVACWKRPKLHMQSWNILYFMSN